jgi:hypothetical protein
VAGSSLVSTPVGGVHTAALPRPLTPRCLRARTCRPQTARRFQKDPQLLDLVGAENTGKLADTISLMTMTVRRVGAAVGVAGGWGRQRGRGRVAGGLLEG